MPIDFSIIIPAKNEEFNMGQCLDSINQVDYEKGRYEIIVVDNGSSDRTVDVAANKGAAVFVQPDLTIAALRNFGARMAKGKILAFLDADCTVAADWLNAAARYLDDTSIAVYGSAPRVPDQATWVQRVWFSIRKKDQPLAPVDWLESMNMFIPREIFLSIEGFDEQLITCEDYELCLRLQAQGQILSDQRIMAVHHGEARDIPHFFRKERWRATSNRSRLLSGQVGLKEYPSLLLPLVYCLLALTCLIMLVLFGLFDASGINVGMVALVLIWQAPLLALAGWKIRHALTLTGVFQLYALLNVYFLARGLACLRRDPR